MKLSRPRKRAKPAVAGRLERRVGPTRAPDHKQAFSFFADDCEAVTVVQALSALIDPENAQTDWLAQLGCLLDYLLQQTCAETKPSERMVQVELDQPQVIWLIFHGKQADIFLGAGDDAAC